MSEEKRKSGGEHDELVSRAYRELSNERTPEHLDQAVLRQAHKAALPPYSRSLLWTKPLAWTAVVAICLVITLQVTQVPAPGDVALLQEAQRDTPSASADTAGPDPIAASPDPAAQPFEPPEPATSGARSGRDASLADADGNSAVLQRAPAATNAARPGTAADRGAPPAPALPAEMDLRDADMLRHAEELRRQRAGDNKEAANLPMAKAATAAAASAERVASDGCSDEDRADPTTWNACIARLERAGLETEARQERARLAQAFPDFDASPVTE